MSVLLVESSYTGLERFNLFQIDRKSWIAQQNDLNYVSTNPISHFIQLLKTTKQLLVLSAKYIHLFSFLTQNLFLIIIITFNYYML